MRMARAAAQDAGAPSALAALDSVHVARLADRLGGHPKHRVYSDIGGTTRKYW